MRQIAFLLHPGVSAMGLAIGTAFEFANAELGENVYGVRMISEAGGIVSTSLGFGVVSEAFVEDEPIDTLVVLGGMRDAEADATRFVRNASRKARRIAAVCTGAMMLAEAGLLNGRRATTHWMRARDFQQRFPSVKVEEDRIFISDGPIWTSAGMTAGLDLALALIEDDHGAETARFVARKLVMYHRRAGGQTQFSTLLELEPKSDRVQTALSYARRNLHKRLSVEDLAEVAGISPRQFSRTFSAETGQSPAKAVEHLRLEAARVLMEESRHSIDFVARETGFADRDRMRRAFLRAFGQPPQVIRRSADAASGRIKPAATEFDRAGAV